MAKLLFTAAYIYAASEKPVSVLPPVVRPMPIMQGMRKNAVLTDKTVLYCGSVSGRIDCGPDNVKHKDARITKQGKLVRIKPMHRDFM